MGPVSAQHTNAYAHYCKTAPPHNQAREAAKQLEQPAKKSWLGEAELSNLSKPWEHRIFHKMPVIVLSRLLDLYISKLPMEALCARSREQNYKVGNISGHKTIII